MSTSKRVKFTPTILGIAIYALFVVALGVDDAAAQAGNCQVVEATSTQGEHCGQEGAACMLGNKPGLCTTTGAPESICACLEPSTLGGGIGKGARGAKFDMVRAYASCPGVTFSAPTTATMAGVPGCNDLTGRPVPLSVFTFDDKKGKCSVRTRQKVENPCKDGSAGACANLSVKAKCSGVMQSDQTTLIEDPFGWALIVVTRVTLDDGLAGTLTMIDFPMQFSFPPAVRGKLGLNADTTTLLNILFGPGNALPATTVLELLSLKIVDPNGDQFATIGSSTR